MQLEDFITSIQHSHVVHKGKRINLDILQHLISPQKPLVYWSMEFYDHDENEIKGGGGLGILAADTRRTAEQLGIPMVVVTPFYTKESHQRLEGFWQKEDVITAKPDEKYRKFGTTVIHTAVHDIVPLNIYDRRLGSTRIITISEPNFGELYQGSNSGDHRLYQEVALGFGGYKSLKMEGYDSHFMQLNEAPTVFAAIARLDDLLAHGHDFEDALREVRHQVLYTNHTLVPAVEGEFSLGQFEHMVMPNIYHEELKNWIRSLFNQSKKLKLSLIAIELSGMKNGVSELHAKISEFYDHGGNRVHFDAVTNGISRKWILPSVDRYYRDLGVLLDNGLPTDDYADALDSISIEHVRALQRQGRVILDSVLQSRKNQYGNPVSIPEDAFIFDFKRRFASYKRPDMLFRDVDRLAKLLHDNNAHFVMTGKPHPNDEAMKSELKRILVLVDHHPVLRNRVHYIQDYDEEVGQALAFGADCAINVPVVGEEACGTSWMKDIANFKLLISTPDGGVADVDPIACLSVEGEDEVDVLYHQMQTAIDTYRDDERYKEMLIKQLTAYVPVFSGPRMMAKYLQLFAENSTN